MPATYFKIYVDNFDEFVVQHFKICQLLGTEKTPTIFTVGIFYNVLVNVDIYGLTCQ